MERDRFACRICKDESSTLNVHHCYYERGREPWDYPDASLLTLCENCHSLQREMIDDSSARFLKMLRRLGVCATDFDGFMASLLPCLGRSEPIGKELDAALLAIGVKDMQRREEPPK